MPLPPPDGDTCEGCAGKLTPSGVEKRYAMGLTTELHEAGFPRALVWVLSGPTYTYPDMDHYQLGVDAGEGASAETSREVFRYLQGRLAGRSGLRIRPGNFSTGGRSLIEVWAQRPAR